MGSVAAARLGVVRWCCPELLLEAACEIGRILESREIHHLLGGEALFAGEQACRLLQPQVAYVGHGRSARELLDFAIELLGADAAELARVRVPAILLSVPDISIRPPS